ncbi:MAG: cell division protein FtsA [Candidatus Goldiibacteriota bacterium]
MILFGLDIGTRKVAGLLGELRGDKVHIIDCAVAEHEKRAMLDGQIHNIDGVSKTVKKIVSELEQRNGLKIEETTTALAGRSLHTEIIKTAAEKKGEVKREDILELEIQGLKKAHERIKERNKKDFYCVGYSVSDCSLDGAPIKELMQQTAAAEIGMRIIVTFLPKIVFDSMISVLKKCSLKLKQITLEPIAALYVAIPEDMRLLNLVLADVGAGTSDIAVTDKGKIIAYGMIPKAGDEITEEICNEFLLDFSGGEKVKRRAETETMKTYDIFNNEITITSGDFEKAIREKTDEVAKDIADEILILNEKQPKAVVMVGGGSGLELLRKRVAANLGLPENRVGTRLPESITNIENLPETLKGTNGITPIGILETGLFNKGMGFIEVEINDEKHYIINMNQKLTVLDALAARGMELKGLYAKPGEALTYSINGDVKIIRGSKGEHSRIYVNREEAGLDTQIKNNDKIYITGPVNGDNASAVIKDVIPHDFILQVSVNGRNEILYPEIFSGGRQISPDDVLKDRSELKMRVKNNIKEILVYLGYSIQASEERDIIITFMGEPVVLKQRNFTMKVNGCGVSPDFEVKNMDKIEFIDRPSYYRIKDVIKSSAKQKMKLLINKKEYEIEADVYDIYMNGRKVSDEEFIINGAKITVQESENRPVLSSVFRNFNMDVSDAKGKALDMRVNGESAGYTTPIKSGDEIEIRFI